MSTLLEELEQAAERVDQLCNEMHGHSAAKACDPPWFECQLKPLATRLRARIEHVRKMLEKPYDANPLAEAVMWSTSNYETYRRDNLRETMKRIGHALCGSIPEQEPGNE